MARLRNLTTIRTLRPRVPTPLTTQERDRARSSLPWRQWYNSKRWRHLRWSILVRDSFTCRKCGRLEHITAKLVADHREPHEGNPDLFWDPANLWCLCKPCHDSVKQSEDRARHRHGRGG